jgi:transcriptional regulator
MKDKEKIIAFMQQFSFGTLVTIKGGLPVATHLPFIVSQRGDKVVIATHLAKANDQRKGIEQDKALLIFTEPHAYISPRHYDKELNVPTWNYIAVHAYGTVRILNNYEEVIGILEATIDTYEQAYRQQWDGLPEDYKHKMAKGIVAFEITVTDLQAKEKLSQNKTAAEQERIIESLAHSTDTNEQLLANYMQRNQPDQKQP